METMTPRLEAVAGRSDVHGATRWRAIIRYVVGFTIGKRGMIRRRLIFPMRPSPTTTTHQRLMLPLHLQ